MSINPSRLAQRPCRMALLLMLLATPAAATTLNITTGSVGMSQDALFDTCASVFSLITCRTSTPLLWPAFLDGTTTVPLAVPSYNSTYNLVMNFVYAPVNWDPDHTDNRWGPTIREPFTMTGTWLKDDGILYDLTGQGTLFCCTHDFHGFPFINVGFLFEPVPTTTPEPQTLLLVGLGLPMIVLLAKRLRA